jgi:hypothetical protein
LVTPCLHPYCPLGRGAASWSEVLDALPFKASHGDRQAVLACLAANFTAPVNSPAAKTPPALSAGGLKRLLQACPCLFNQLDLAATATSIVHFCEITLGTAITSANVHQAFLIQHPRSPDFTVPPIKECGTGGTVMELLCSAVLTSAGLPVMRPASDGWPAWQMPGHILLNQGKMSTLRALGDILVPCAPTNLVISVKSEVARERLLYSANSIEGIGFGFFREPQEFWTTSRMSLYKRMGFTAIYMPDETHAAVMAHVVGAAAAHHAVNINGTDLYRPLTCFGEDMSRVVGRSSALL